MTPIPRLLPLLVATLGLVAPAAATTLPANAQADDPTRLCRAAIRTAERAAGIPQALLSALGRVESGRRNPETGNFGPWPWTINAEGRGQFFPTKAEAVAAVRRLQAEGVRSIDIGCMQINLRHHPNAFASLEDGFDPAKNTAYAAQFLTQLYENSKNWLQAASHYHSQTPEFAQAYQRRVMAAWPEESRIAAEEFRQTQLAAWAQRPAPQQAGPGGLLNNGGMGRIQAAATGRRLDAYRAAPIAPAFAPRRVAAFRRAP
ncbi:transglycosylase SLT domain-containing protein [Elioraea rosea]|uniref:transglycosylase SLT domain-containing protein n=1 Tax=Elioraea rosea TaxID=2492390 RepID=UPI0019500951|nr:transglycosylase SLT domain-containing protein [Elioraea rosea]